MSEPILSIGGGDVGRGDGFSLLVDGLGTYFGTYGDTVGHKLDSSNIVGMSVLSNVSIEISNATSLVS